MCCKSMNLILLAWILSMTLTACGGEGDAPSSLGTTVGESASPVKTEIGKAIGTATSAIIGVAGGTLISDDQRISLKIPPAL